MVLQVRASEYLLLINDIHGPLGALRYNDPDRFCGLCNGLCSGRTFFGKKGAEHIIRWIPVQLWPADPDADPDEIR